MFGVFRLFEIVADASPSQGQSSSSLPLRVDTGRMGKQYMGYIGAYDSLLLTSMHCKNSNHTIYHKSILTLYTVFPNQHLDYIF